MDQHKTFFEGSSRGCAVGFTVRLLHSGDYCPFAVHQLMGYLAGSNSQESLLLKRENFALLFNQY
jgi:hypothetical protein